MRKTIRGVLVAGIAVTALAGAGSALAAFTPKITIKNVTGGISVDARVQAATDDPTAQVLFYIPTGYQLGTPSPGADLGDVNATAQAADLGGAVLPLTGDVLAAAPGQFATQQAQCVQTTPVLVTWDIHLTAAGQTLDVPAFIVATTGVETALGANKMVICLPPPDVPVGTPGRAQFGAKLLSATFTSSGLTAPTATGEFRWRSMWTPYTPNTGRPNPAGTVEVQSAVRSPTQLRLTAKKSRVTKTVRVKGKRVKQVWTRVALSGSLTENAQGIGGVSVTLTSNGRRLKVVKTSASGTFGTTVLFRAGTLTFGGSATVPDRDLGAAGCVKTAAAPCNDATVGGSALKANTVKVTAYKR